MLGALTLPGAAGAADAAPSQPGVTVVARGFNGPFGIAFGPKGLYVAESDAGKVTTANLGSGAQSTYLRGLTSVTGVSVASNGTVWAVTGETGRPGPRSTRLYRAPHRGHATVVANLLAYELAHNPDGQSQKAQDSKSNPFAVLRLPGRTLVADAGANDVVQLTDNGRLSTFFVPGNLTTGVCKGARNNDPRHPGCDPVPTGVTLGADGFLYVSGLGAEAPGASRIWKLNARTGALVKTYTGFTALTGIAATADGSLYASEVLFGAPAGNPGPGFDPSTVGRLTRIAPNGARTRHDAHRPRRARRPAVLLGLEHRVVPGPARGLGAGRAGERLRVPVTGPVGRGTVAHLVFGRGLWTPWNATSRAALRSPPCPQTATRAHDRTRSSPRSAPRVSGRVWGPHWNVDWPKAASTPRPT